MKSKFSKFLSVLAIPMLVGVLASCGEIPATSTPTTSTPTPTTDPTTDPTTGGQTAVITEDTTINIWSIIGDNNVSDMENFIKAFKTIEPKVTVVHTKQTGMGYNELKNAVVNGFSANNYPDMVQCYPDHVAEYIQYEKAVNLQPYMDNADYGFTAEDLDDYVPAYLEEGRNYGINGTYSLPFQKSTEAMFYNEDVLLNSTVATGIVEKDKTINGGRPISASYLNNLTWEELFNKLCPAIVAYDNDLPEAEKILKKDQAYHSVFAYDSDDNLFITLAEQYGYPYTSVNKVTGKGNPDFNNDQMKGLAATFNTAAKNGYIISKGSAGGNYTNAYFTLQNTLFSVGSTGGVKYQFDEKNPMNVGVASIPHAEGRDKKVISQGPSIAVLDHNSENQKLASFLFYKFMTNPENAITWCVNTGYAGIRKSVYESDEYIEVCDETATQPKTLEKLKARAYKYITSCDDYLFTSPVFVGSASCRTQAGGLMTKILNTDSDIAEVDKWFLDAYNAAKVNCL